MSRKILTAIDLILKDMLTYLLRNTPTPTYSTYYLRPDGGASPSETSTSEVNTNSHRWPPVGPPVGQLVTAKSKKIATGTLSISGRYEPADEVDHFGVDCQIQQFVLRFCKADSTEWIVAGAKSPPNRLSSSAASFQPGTTPYGLCDNTFNFLIQSTS